jgi:hypothetical protein
MLDWAAFDAMEAEWVAVPHGRTQIQDFDAWAADMTAMRNEHDELLNNGAWLFGPDDLLSVVGRRTHELTHSAMIAWLMDPTGRHGLARTVLDGLLVRLWPEKTLPSTPIRVEREVDQRVERVQARADVIVRAGDSIIVLENKVGAGEGHQQCWRLHEVWKDEAQDVRWVLLTLDGSPPRTAGDAVASWLCLSYRDLRDIIVKALAAVPAREGTGRQTLSQYLITLESIVRRYAPG